jgi:hypothetical protein
VNGKEIRDLAREKMGAACRVCPICNGVVYAGQVPGMGGTGRGRACLLTGCGSIDDIEGRIIYKYIFSGQTF